MGIVQFGAVDALALLAGYWASATVIEIVATAVDDPDVPSRSPDLTAKEYTPQHENDRLTSPSKWLSSCTCRTGSFDFEESCRRLAGDADPSCPAEFRGVWWTKGNPFPMTLIAVHRGRWSSDGRRVRLWTGRGIAYDPTLAGLLLRLVMSFEPRR